MEDIELPQHKIEEYRDMEMKTAEEACLYVCKQMNIGSTMYYEEFYPKIENYFIDRFINHEKQTARNRIIPKKRLDKEIALIHAEVDKKLQERIEGKEF